MPDYQSTSGLRKVIFARRDEGDLTHFLLITIWDSIEAMERFTGGDPYKAKYYPEDDKYLNRKGGKRTDIAGYSTSLEASSRNTCFSISMRSSSSRHSVSNYPPRTTCVTHNAPPGASAPGSWPHSIGQCIEAGEQLLGPCYNAAHAPAAIPGPLHGAPGEASTPPAGPPARPAGLAAPPRGPGAGGGPGRASQCR